MNLTDVDGWTPTHIAAELQRDDVVLTLMRCGANTHLKNRRNVTPYELMSNHELKSLATMRMLKDDELVECRNPPNTDLYERMDNLSINQNLEIAVCWEVEQQVLEERRVIWLLTQLPTKTSTKPATIPLDSEVLEVLLARNTEWIIPYLSATGLHTADAIAELLVKQYSRFSRHIVLLLAKPNLACMYDIAVKTLSGMLCEGESLVSHIVRLFSGAKLPRDVLPLSFLCEMFALAWRRFKRQSLTSMELVQRLLFAVLFAAARKILTEETKRIVVELAEALALPSDQMGKLLQFKTTVRASKKYSLQEAKISGQ